MKKYFSIILPICLLLSTSIISCNEEKSRPSYDQLLEEHEEQEFTDKFFMFLIGVVTVVVIYRNVKKDK